MPTSSSNHQVTEFVVKFLLQGNPRQGLMLTGGWGSGKTWQFENVIRPRATASDCGYKVCYVSAWGMSGIGELQEAIAMDLIGKGYADNPAAKALGALITGSAEAAGMPGVDLVRGMGSTLAGMIKSHATRKAMQDKILVVIDDVERCDIDPTALFGYLSTIMAGDKSRLLLISNEEKDQLDDKYHSIKEKLISHTLRIEPDLDAFLDDLHGRWPEGAFKNFLRENRARILDVLRRVKEPNLRAVRVAAQNGALLVEAMSTFTVPPAQLASLSDFRTWYFDLCFGATLFKRMLNRPGKDYLERFGVRGAFSATSGSEEEGLADVQRGMEADALFDQISGGKYQMTYPPDFLVGLVDHGRLDTAEVVNYLDDQFRVSWTDVRHAIHIVSNGSVLSASDGEAKAAYDLVWSEIQNGRINDPRIFLTLANQLLGAAERCWQAPARILDRLKEAARITRFETEEPVGRTGPHMHPDAIQVQDAIDKSVSDRVAADVREKALEVFASQGPVAVLTAAANDQSPRFEFPTLSHLDRDAFWSRLVECSNDEIGEADSHARFRIVRGDARRIDQSDKAWLIGSIPILDRLIQGKPVSVSRHLLTSLRDYLVQIRSLEEGRVAEDRRQPGTPDSEPG